MGKTVVSASTKKETRTQTQADGTIVETTTTTTTETFSDGTTGVKTQTETKTRKSGSGGGGGKPPESPAESKAPKAENTTDKKWIQEALDEHNILREKHGSPPMTLNEDLNKIAQAWANHLAKQGKMEHSTTSFGENIYWSTDKIDGKRPVDQWYSEVKDYNFGKLEGQKGTGHFTQVIWKASTELGIALAQGPKGSFVVANYYPAGNFVGQYRNNIQKA